MPNETPRERIIREVRELFEPRAELAIETLAPELVGLTTPGEAEEVLQAWAAGLLDDLELIEAHLRAEAEDPTA